MTTQIRSLDVDLTPQQQLAFAFRGFSKPSVIKRGDLFHAYAIKPAPIGYEWAEFLGRSPEIAVQQLSLLVARA